MKYMQLIFSPTGGTEKAAALITAEWSSSVETIDLTNASADFSKCSVAPDDLVLIALPSFGGRVPALAAGRLSQVRGSRLHEMYCPYAVRRKVSPIRAQGKRRVGIRRGTGIEKSVQREKRSRAFLLRRGAIMVCRRHPKKYPLAAEKLRGWARR